MNKMILGSVMLIVLIWFGVYVNLNIDVIEQPIDDIPDDSNCIKLDNGKTLCKMGTVTVDGGVIKEQDLSPIDS